MFTRLSVVLFMIFSFSAIARPGSIVCETSGEFEKDMIEITTVTTGGNGGADDCSGQPSEEDIENLCNETQEQNTVTINRIQVYKIELLLKKMSCVTSDVEAKEKVQRMWNKYWPSFKCDISGYSLSGKNVLRYAVKLSFNDFLYRMKEVYEIDLNVKDPADNKTILEFCKEEIAKRDKERPRTQSRVDAAVKSCSIIGTSGS